VELGTCRQGSAQDGGEPRLTPPVGCSGRLCERSVWNARSQPFWSSTSLAGSSCYCPRSLSSRRLGTGTCAGSGGCGAEAGGAVDYRPQFYPRPG